MRLRQWVCGSVLAVVTLAVFAMTVMSGSQSVYDYVMFAGDTDSTEQQTRWIQIDGASRVILRSWSTHLGFGANADTAKVDTIAGWRVLFSDSICCMVTGPEGYLIPSAADSIVNAAAIADTSKYGIGVYELPVNKVLQSATNGSGIMTFVEPIQSGSLLATPSGTLSKKWMRVRFTPVRRATQATWSATVQNRANGLRRFKMVARVVYDNR
jgi:hypothetical protein